MRKIINGFLTILIFVAIILVFNASPKVEAEEDISYNNKIISVVYDNSGSMLSVNKNEYALYSLKLLISVLSPSDKVMISPLNNGTIEVSPSNPYTINVDMQTEDRKGAIDKAIAKIPSSTGSTPPGAIDVAINNLIAEGLTTNDKAGENNSKEYWLIILTDGVFNNVGSSFSDYLTEKIKNYSLLNTIYYSFCSGALDLRDSEIVKNYPVSAYYAEDTNQITSQMIDIANKLTRRYSVEQVKLDYKYYAKIDLSTYNIALSSISIASQNSGLELQSIKLDNVDITNKITKYDIDQFFGYVDGKQARLGRNGYLSTLKLTEPLNSGILELQYKEVNKTIPDNFKDFRDVTDPNYSLDIMVEPAVYISPFYQIKKDGSYIDVDMQYINSSLKPNDVMKVKYKICDQMTGKEIPFDNLRAIFGDEVTKITYCGKQYDIGDDITLIKGKNALTIDVRFSKTNFTVYSTIMCIIEEDPTYYRLESSELINSKDEIKDNGIEYVLFVENKPLQIKEEVEKYLIKIKVIDPSGNEKEIDYQITNDGKIKCDFSKVDSYYGNYQVLCTVTSPENISRSIKQTIRMFPTDFGIETLTQDGFTTTEYLAQSNTTPIEFALKYKDKELSFSEGFTYKVTIDGYDVTSKAVVDGAKISIVPNFETLQNISAGQKNVILEVSNSEIGSKSVDFIITINKTIYEVKSSNIQNEVIDIYNLKNCSAYGQFKVLRDGIPLSYEEVKQLYDEGKIKIDKNSWGMMAFLPYKIETTVEELYGQGVITCKVVGHNSLLSSFIFRPNKSIEVSYLDSADVQEFTFTNVPTFDISRIIRWVVILLIIWFIIHMILYFVGFKTLASFPSCVLVNISVRDDKVSAKCKPINISNSDIRKWHLKRLLPFNLNKRQKPFDTKHGSLYVDNQNNNVYRVKNKSKNTLKICKFNLDVANDSSEKIKNFIIAIREVNTEKGLKGCKLIDVNVDSFMECFEMEENKNISNVVPEFPTVYATFIKEDETYKLSSMEFVVRVNKRYNK